jgi:hypothetical protein
VLVRAETDALRTRRDAMRATRIGASCGLWAVVMSATVLAWLVFGLAGAGAAPRAGVRIAVTGCPYAGVTATCLMLNDTDGTVYNVSGASPWPRLIGRMIWLRGTVSTRTSLCAQGIVLERIRWTRLRQQCPK